MQTDSHDLPLCVHVIQCLEEDNNDSSLLRWGSSWDKTVRLAYVTSLRTEGKQTHVLCNLKTLPTKELKELQSTAAGKSCLWYG
jgi:hypothetical protein